MQGFDATGRGTRTVTRAGTALALAALVVAGCAGAGSGPGPQTTTVTTATATTTTTRTNTATATTTHPGLEARLAGLLAAENRTAYAEGHGIDLRDGRVDVVVELAPGRSLPADAPVAVTARHDELVQGRVPVGALESLAAHGNVSRVRAPDRPVPDGGAR